MEGIIEIEIAQKKTTVPDEASTPYDSDEAMSEVKFRPPKRNYSQMDLDAAVSDIRNGKLGTRRFEVYHQTYCPCLVPLLFMGFLAPLSGTRYISSKQQTN